MEHKFKIGDEIIIKEKPTSWASLLNPNNPIDKDIYPYKCKIKDIKDEGDYIGMTCGNYGWSLQHLISTNNIELLEKSQSKSLVGRYLKALINQPNGGNVKKGEYGLITHEYADIISSTVDFPNHKGYCINRQSYQNGDSYELMPEGFKPTFTKFQVGKWYKNLASGYMAKAIKDSRIDGNSFYHGDYITNDKKFVANSKSSTSLLWLDVTCEADLSEIQQYLPADHPDKIKSEWIPQVGDWAVYTSGSSSILEKNKCYKISFSGEHEGSYKIMTPELDKAYPSKKGWSSVKNFRKPLPHEIPSSSNSVSSSVPIKGGKDDLLTEAKRRYPVGTEFICIHTGSKYIIESLDEFEDDNQCIRVMNGCRALTDYSGKWAEIINLPESKKDSFVLPEKWCVKAETEEEADIIYKFNGIAKHSDSKSKDWFQHYPPYDIENGYVATDYVKPGYTEITFDQFKEHVLKEMPERKENKSWIDLTKEAKEMYPIGSTFYDLVHKESFVVASHNFDSFGNDNQIYVSVDPRPDFTNKTARLYKDGVWATKSSINYAKSSFSLFDDSKYIAGIDPYQVDDRVMAMNTAIRASQKAISSMMGISPTKMTAIYPLTPDQCYKYPLLSIEEEDVKFDSSLIKPIKSVNLLLSIED